MSFPVITFHGDRNVAVFNFSVSPSRDLGILFEMSTYTTSKTMRKEG